MPVQPMNVPEHASHDARDKLPHAAGGVVQANRAGTLTFGDDVRHERLGDSLGQRLIKPISTQKQPGRQGRLKDAEAKIDPGVHEPAANQDGLPADSIRKLPQRKLRQRVDCIVNRVGEDDRFKPQADFFAPKDQECIRAVTQREDDVGSEQMPEGAGSSETAAAPPACPLRWGAECREPQAPPPGR